MLGGKTEPGVGWMSEAEPGRAGPVRSWSHPDAPLRDSYCSAPELQNSFMSAPASGGASEPGHCSGTCPEPEPEPCRSGEKKTSVTFDLLISLRVAQSDLQGEL